MAQTFSNANEILRFANDSTIGELTEVAFAADARSCLVQFFDSGGTVGTAGKVALVGVDGAAIGADYITVGADATLSLTLYGDDSTEAILKIYVASSVASGIVEIVSSELP